MKLYRHMPNTGPDDTVTEMEEDLEHNNNAMQAEMKEHKLAVN